MRMTLMAFAAITGGARGFKCIPYDVLNKRKTADAIRVSTNIPLILKKEGYLCQVKNPLDGGSLFSETVDVLCKSAWTAFQEIERKGGVFEAVRTGWLQTELKRAAEYSKNQMSYLQHELVGVNRFVSKTPSYGSEGDIIRLSEIIDPLFLSRSADDYLTVEPLLVSSLSYEWEALQMASDRFAAVAGRRPRVVAVKGGGPVVEKKFSWLTTVLGLGGVDVEVMAPERADSVENWSSLVILVTSGEELEQSLSQILRTKGVEKIWSLDHAKKETDVDRYLDSQMNALEFVKDVQQIVLEAR
jgi:methylmalonyl-CoA mutase